METGTRLGPYEILEQLGAGGMGEVWLAQDTRLGRKVAIKVLPEEFASDPERLARFEQEARAAAALNHPHIAVVHDIGTEGDTHFMVQEYLQGQSLRERLEKGVLPLAKALELATEVGEALTVAHAAGIVHRDLKPDNIFVTEQGHAKVLDFGLAKLMEMAAPAGGSASMSPTMLGTVAGQVMGTAGYMAPEQVNGEETDQRADLFAFGCVLYESITGKQPFVGKSVPDTLSRILHHEPEPLAEVDDSLPFELQRILKKCLAKEPAKRYQAAGDLVVDLQALAADVESGKAPGLGTGSDEATTLPAARRSILLPVAMGVVLAAAALALGVALERWLAGSPRSPVPMHLELLLPADHELAGGSRSLLISPDGTRIVYRANTDDGSSRLYVRRMDGGDSLPLLPGSAGGGGRIFFDLDGQWLGFSSNNELKKVRVDGGEPIPLTDAIVDGDAPYGAWQADGTIVFESRQGFFRVADTGGEPTFIAGPDEPSGFNAWERPESLPGSRAVLFELKESSDVGQIATLDLVTGDVQPLNLMGSEPRYVSTGHLLYVRENTLFAVAFDATTLQVTGTSVPMVQGVHVAIAGAAAYDVSDNGTLVYRPIGVGPEGTLAWVDRTGTVTAIDGAGRPSSLRHPRLSLDGRKVAVEVDDGAGIVIFDLDRSAYTDFAIEGSTNQRPLWSGGLLYFASDRGGDLDIYAQPADRSEGARPIVIREGSQRPLSISPDGSRLLFGEASESGGFNVWAINADGTGDAEPVLDGAFNEYSSVLSPDGKLIAYLSDEFGESHLYFSSFPLTSRRQVSDAPAAAPRWSSDSRTLYWLSYGGAVWQASILNPGEVLMGPANRLPVDLLGGGRLFGGGALRVSFDVDGEGRFLIATRGAAGLGPDAPESPRLSVIVNWFEELKERAPTGR